RLIPGTQGADYPVFSPDGAWIAFAADQKIKKVAVAGGEPIVLHDGIVGRLGLTWGPEDNILFSASPSKGIWRVSARGGGAPSAVTTVGNEDVDHRYPDELPDGKL